MAVYTYRNNHGNERKKAMSTKFDKDLKLMETDADASIMILRERKAQLERIERQGRACKNKFRLECLAQEYNQLKREYDALDQMI